MEIFKVIAACVMVGIVWSSLGAGLVFTGVHVLPIVIEWVMQLGHPYSVIVGILLVGGFSGVFAGVAVILSNSSR